MNVTYFSDAQPYQAPLHFDMRSLRLQGADVTDVENFWVGLSHFLPGGGASWDASPLEKVYVVLSGEMVVRTKSEEATLGALDSCVIPAGEEREIINRSNLPASMLVVMPTKRD